MANAKIKQIKVENQVVNATIEGDLDGEFIIVTDVARRLAAAGNDGDSEYSIQESYPFDEDPADVEAELVKFLDFMETITYVREYESQAKDLSTGEDVPYSITTVADDEAVLVTPISDAGHGRKWSSSSYLEHLLPKFVERNVAPRNWSGLFADELVARAALWIAPDRHEALIERIDKECEAWATAQPAKSGILVNAREYLGRPGKTSLPKKAGSELLQQLVKRV